MPRLELTPDELLTTTRAVRRRLDLTRPVERDVLEECLQLAQQAPTGGFAQNWHFVVVTDAEKRARLGEFWRESGERYLTARARAASSGESSGGGRGDGQAARIGASVVHLLQHIGDVPVHLIPCVEGRTDGLPAWHQAGRFGSILPATWSFMLAARSRGLGTVWTTFHLAREREAAELLGIPYEEVQQVALIPVAYTLGTDFRPGPRRPLDTMVHWDGW